jgi:hypothetical protein
MKKEELLQLLRPLIKECIKEVIFEDGVISTVVNEALKVRMPEQTMVTEAKFPNPMRAIQQTHQQQQAEPLKKRKIPQRAGDAADFNPFSGTRPIS